MITFLTGLVILIAGGAIYGRLCEHVFGPDDRQTPAYAHSDGIDYVPMKKWKNSLVNLLNIAGTGPIIGPIQGILFGPIAFITIPVGCVLGGAMHDYFSGMICTREGGIQMPELIKRNLNKVVYWFFTAFILITSFLCGVVFVYTPGDIAATQLLGFGGTPSEASTWIIYGVIFMYYIIATILPIDKIIGKVYPIFGALLLLSAVGIFVLLLIRGDKLCEIWGGWTLGGFDFGAYFRSNNFIPNFFVTVACGIMSGFHSSQTALISRTLQKEKHGRMAFYNMMMCESFIAMVWAAGTMALIGLGAEDSGITMQMTESGWGYFQSVGGTLRQISATSVVGVVCKNMLGNAGGIIAIIGVVVLPISTGDTAFRAIRVMISETLHIDQKSTARRLVMAVPIFVLAFGLLIWAKTDSNGFNIIWRYMGWGNQTLSVFATASMIVYFMRHGKTRYIWMPAIPLLFYAFVTSCYISGSSFGLSLNMTLSYIIGGVFATGVFAASVIRGRYGQLALAKPLR